ncbi:MAG: helix-turn-helix transcriptional regulator [Terrimicrobiaceae bacterium]
MKAYTHPSLDDVSLTAVMQALSDPCRVSIVQALLAEEERELACNEISLDVANATRSHHFDVLREAGIIFTRCEGTRCMSSVRRRELNKRFPGLLKLISHEA